VRFAARLAAVALLVALGAGAATAAEHVHPAQEAAMAEGEIRRVDRESRKLTIRHGPLVKLDMPPMTMVFAVKDPALLEQVKPGDKVRFEAEKIGGVYTVTRMEAAR
jgi:Cu/Ag efflux protein CusF